MKTKILFFHFFFSIGFSAQIFDPTAQIFDWTTQLNIMRENIKNKYQIENAEIFPPRHINEDDMNDYNSIKYYFAKINNTIRVYNNEKGELLDDYFVTYATNPGFTIAINTNKKGEKEWLFYDAYYSVLNSWKPLRIPYNTYEKIIFSDDSEWPDCIGIKGNEKQVFELDFEGNKICFLQKENGN